MRVYRPCLMYMYTYPATHLLFYYRSDAYEYEADISLLSASGHNNGGLSCVSIVYNIGTYQNRSVLYFDNALLFVLSRLVRNSDIITYTAFNIITLRF